MNYIEKYNNTVLVRHELGKGCNILQDKDEYKW